MSNQKLVLEEVSQRMGIELPKAGDLSQGLQPKPTGASALEEDSQPPEKNPKLQILLIGLALFSTLGVGTMLLLSVDRKLFSVNGTMRVSAFPSTAIWLMPDRC
jgi:hypothetical protein